MSEKTHWLQSPNKNYLGHWDLPESGEMVVTIASAQWEAVENPILSRPNNPSVESKRVIRFEGNIKPFICNQTNAQSIVRHTGVKWMEDSIGHQICLYVAQIMDRKTKEQIDCIRIKAKPKLTQDDLRTLFEDKAANIPPNEIEAVQSAVNSSDSSKYQRVYNYLSKL